MKESANMEKFLARDINDPREVEPSSAVGVVRKSNVQNTSTTTSIHQRKPHIVFDVNDASHRQLYANFMTNRHWDTNAPRFLIEQPYATVPAMVADKMLAYYMSHDKDVTLGNTK